MGRNNLIDRLDELTQNRGYQVVLCDVSGKLSRKIHKCESLTAAIDFVARKRQEALSRKPRRNQYMIWLRKGTWNAVTIESGFLRKSD
jgi:hypothetical protein